MKTQTEISERAQQLGYGDIHRALTEHLFSEPDHLGQQISSYFTQAGHKLYVVTIRALTRVLLACEVETEIQAAPC